MQLRSNFSDSGALGGLTGHGRVPATSTHDGTMTHTKLRLGWPRASPASGGESGAKYSTQIGSTFIPRSASFSQIRLGIDRNRAKLNRLRPNMVRNRATSHMLGRSGPCLAEAGSNWARNRPDIGPDLWNIGRNLTTCGPTSAKSDPDLADRDQKWPRNDLMWPEFDQSCPSFGATREAER